MSDLRNKIVLAEGTDYERTIYLNKPKGRKAREMMPKVLAFMSELSKSQDNGSVSDVEEVSNMMLKFWSKSEFEDVLVPFVLQMDTVEGKRYLDENCTTVEIIDAFSKAAQYLIEESFQRAEVEEALGKSTEEAQEARKAKKVS
jgi:hypothetical protein